MDPAVTFPRHDPSAIDASELANFRGQEVGSAVIRLMATVMVKLVNDKRLRSVHQTILGRSSVAMMVHGCGGQSVVQN